MSGDWEGAGTWRRGIAAGVFLVQCVALYLPGQHGPSSELPWDKAAHLVLFAVVAFVGVWARVPWPWVVGILLAQAGISEAVQQFLLPDRGGEWGDIAADLIGIGVGIGAGLAVTSRVGSADGAGRD